MKPCIVDFRRHEDDKILALTDGQVVDVNGIQVMHVQLQGTFSMGSYIADCPELIVIADAVEIFEPPQSIPRDQLVRRLGFSLEKGDPMETPEEHNSDQMEDQSASGEAGIVADDETPVEVDPENPVDDSASEAEAQPDEG